MSMIDIKQISNDPTTGKKRQVEWIGANALTIHPSMKGEPMPALRLTFSVTLLEDDGSVYQSSRIINPYQKNFVADNSTSVNAQGQYVSDDSPDRVSGEYDFLKTALRTQPAVPLVEVFIGYADLMKRFD